MPQITAIKPQEKRKNRFNVYLDGQFALAISNELLVREGLKVGQELSFEKREELVAKDRLGKAQEQIYRFLSYRPRSEKEIYDYLGKKKLKEEEKERIIKKLKEEKLIDDLEFARWFLEQRQTFRPKGSYALRQELRQKGIGEKIIDQVLPNKEEELSLAKKALVKAEKKYASFLGREKKEKLMAYLRRRGFSWEAVKKAVDEREENG
ncbi:MAG TPA: RecX family transcriptional regulator [Candidatus Woesebacteria bacterium]|nr:RecX family transcriptional regulator [Candidatus Woesebacteria bacterium]